MQGKQELKGLHLITGEKGGVGKSLWAMALLEYFHSKGIAYRFYDTDRTSPDVGMSYEPDKYAPSIPGESKPPKGKKYKPDNQADKEGKSFRLYFSEEEEDVFLADHLFSEASEGNLVLVNLPAQVALVVDHWLLQRGILSLASSEGVGITFWFVTDGSPESLELLEKSLSTYQASVAHVVVYNKGLSKKAKDNVAAHRVKESIQKHAIATVEMPLLSLSPSEKVLLKTERIRLGDAADRTKSNKLTIIAKQRVKNFLKECHQAIEKTNLFGKAEVEQKDVAPQS